MRVLLDTRFFSGLLAARQKGRGHLAEGLRR